MLLRFTTLAQDSDSGHSSGLLVEAHLLRDEGQLSKDEHEELRMLLAWFTDNLPVPKVLNDVEHRRAISWFKPTAHHGVAAGTYTITAKATDNLGLAATSSVAIVTVGAPSTPGTTQAFYIHGDQINTAREIWNATGVKVWETDLEPFGVNLPNENPAGQGVFTYNPRFPG